VSEKKFYVYEHWRPDRGECFYVGKGHGKRANDLAKRNLHHKAIQIKLSRLGLAVEIKIIAMDLDESAAFAKEIERIAFWRNDGADLVNRTDGGIGVVNPSQITRDIRRELGKKRIVSEETRKKISAAHKGRPKSPEHRAKIGAKSKGRQTWLGRSPTREHRDKIASAHRGRKRSDADRAAMRAAKSSPEWKENFGAKYRGVPKSAAHVEKMRLANLGKTHTEETRLKLTEIMHARWSDPAYREKIRLARTGKKRGPYKKKNAERVD
jgi:hypothetical protein